MLVIKVIYLGFELDFEDVGGPESAFLPAKDVLELGRDD